MAGRSGDPGATVLRRAARLLGVFAADDGPLSLSELTRRSGLPRSTAHRLAAELVAIGMLDREGDGYAIGTRLWELGELAPVSLRLRERALPHLQTLYEATGENVHLAVLDGTEALYVARITGRTSIPTLSRMGGRLPLHTTGVGKALLAMQDQDWLDRYLSAPLLPETRHSLTDAARLREDLAITRTRGYAVTRQEMTLGNVSLAAALPPIPGLPAAAIGVVSHLTRVDESRIAPLVVRTAAEIAASLASH